MHGPIRTDLLREMENSSHHVGCEETRLSWDESFLIRPPSDGIPVKRRASGAWRSSAASPEAPARRSPCYCSAAATASRFMPSFRSRKSDDAL